MSSVTFAARHDALLFSGASPQEALDQAQRDVDVALQKHNRDAG